jgi:hypothetical protein
MGLETKAAEIYRAIQALSGSELLVAERDKPVNGLYFARDGLRSQRRTYKYLPVLFEDWDQSGRLGNGTAWSRRLEFFKEGIDSARDNSCDRPAGGAADVLEGMASASCREYRIARPGTNVLPVYFEPEFALQNVPPLVLFEMDVKRWTLKWRRASFENGKRAGRITTRDLDSHFRTQDVNTAALAPPHDRGCEA